MLEIDYKAHNKWLDAKEQKEADEFEETCNKQEFPNGVIGLWTCSCHLFENYEAADKAKKQKFEMHTTVTDRCTQEKGKIISSKENGYYLVSFGPLSSDRANRHAQELIKTQ